MVPLGLLKAAAYNPRKMTEKDAADLRDSLVTFGMVDPLVVNTHEGREHVVVGGHQRLRLAVALGWAEVPCVFVDLPLAQERELNLRLNHNSGRWDWDILANEFEIAELVAVGFTDEEIGLVGTAELPAMQAGKGEFESISLHVGPVDAAAIRAALAKLKESGEVTRDGIGNDVGRACGILARRLCEGNSCGADQRD